MNARQPLPACVTAEAVAAAPLLEVRRLSLQAAGRCLVRELDWVACRGERWSVIGRNAVGKSTLLRALAGLGQAAAGEIRWLGRAQHQWPGADAAAVRAFVPQQASDRFAISVRRLIELSVVVPGAGDPMEVLQALDADALAERGVMQLSGGERQRVALAQCRLQGAPLMLMDEPVAFQDPAHQLQVAHWLTRQRDACLVVTAHDINWIARASTHVLALFGDGAWEHGPLARMLTAERLQRVYGCPWREAGGTWVADPG